jgi:hypothetical protein
MKGDISVRILKTVYRKQVYEMLFVVFCVLLFVHGSTPFCRESVIFGLLDCSNERLESIDHLVTSKREWVVVIDFKRNRLVSFNVTELLLSFPNLQRIDVHVRQPHT